MSTEPETLARHMKDFDGFSRWLGIEYVTVQDSHSVLRMRVRPEMLNGFGICHGGVLGSLADSAMAFAANGDVTVHVAIENRIIFLEPVREGEEVVAIARALGKGRRIRHFDVELQVEGRGLVARFSGSVYRTNSLLQDVKAKGKL